MGHVLSQVIHFIGQNTFSMVLQQAHSLCPKDSPCPLLSCTSLLGIDSYSDSFLTWRCRTVLDPSNFQCLAPPYHDPHGGTGWHRTWRIPGASTLRSTPPCASYRGAGLREFLAPHASMLGSALLWLVEFAGPKSE